MNIMKKTLVAAVAATSMAIDAQALVIDLGLVSGQPAGATNEFNRLVNQVNSWNVANEPDLPSPDADTYAYSDGNSEKSLTLDLTDLNGYLMFKWGSYNQFYYVEGETSATFLSTAFNSNTGPALGLSHLTTWLTSATTIGGDGDPDPTPVSDSSNSAAMFGLAIVGLAGFRNKIQKGMK